MRGYGLLSAYFIRLGKNWYNVGPPAQNANPILLQCAVHHLSLLQRQLQVHDTLRQTVFHELHQNRGHGFVSRSNSDTIHLFVC